MRKKLLLILITLAMLSCVTPQDDQITLILSKSYHLKPVSLSAVKDTILVENNLPFYSDGECELCLDIAYPSDNSAAHPAIIYVYGCAWGYRKNAHRSQFYNSIQQAAENGYAAVTVDHRMTCVKEEGSSKYQYPAQVNDLQEVVHWLKDNAEKYNIDTKKVGIVGWSSGAHLSMLLAFSGESELPIGAVVDMCGPVDLKMNYSLSKYSKTALTDYLGGSPDEVPDIYKAASPINYINSHTPPVLLMYGDADKVVTIDEAYLLQNKLNNSGVPNKLIVKENGIHMRFSMNDDIWNFLDTYLN